MGYSPWGHKESDTTEQLTLWTSQEVLVVKNPPASAVRTLGQEEPLEEDMAAHPSILAWRIPWTEEPVGYSPGDLLDPGIKPASPALQANSLPSKPQGSPYPM